MLISSEAALKEFSSPDFRTGNAISTISVRKLWALIQVGQNKEAITEGKRLMNQLSPGSVQWYRIGHYTLKAQIYSGNYSGAIETITEMIENPKFQKLGDYFTEIFMAALGYIHLLVDSDIVDRTKIKNLELPEFKLAKFLNTTPVFSKDKRGINVSILLMHIGFLLQRKEYGVIIDKIDSLNQYAYRYLRKDDSFRSNCMIKMVVQMAKADFHPVRTERYTTDLRDQLGNVALSGSGDNIEIEIVPFEVLWQIMKSTL